MLLAICSSLAVGLFLAHARARAAEPSLPAEIRLVEGDPCDGRNKKLYIENAHQFRTFAVLVQWRADGGKELTEKVVVAPHVVQELGCAAQGKILEALPADF